MSLPIRIVTANVVIFAILKLAWVTMPAHILDMDAVVEALALPATARDFAVRPWTMATYMFTHIDFWHLLVNSLWLAWFGTLLTEIAGRGWALWNFVAGGVAGGVCYLLFSSVAAQPSDACLLGASAATMGVISAAMVAAPGKKVKMALVGTFSLRWVAAAGFVLFLLASLEMAPSQTAAHLGGIATGVISATVWRLHTRRNMRVMQQQARLRLEHHELVEKARQSGYASLTNAEKLQLFNLSSSGRTTGNG